MATDIDPITVDQLKRLATARNLRSSSKGADRTGPPPNQMRLELSPEARAEVIEYLRLPERAGVWRARFNWIDLGGISGELWMHLKSHEDVVAEYNDEGSILGFSGDLPNTTSIFERITARLSTLLKIFAHIHEAECNGGDTETKYYRYASWRDRLILANVNINSIKSKYSAAYQVFAEHIITSGFRCDIAADHAFLVRGGIVVLHASPYYSNNVVLYSNKKDALEALGEFLIELGKISKHQPRKVFSSDDSVYGAYFGFLYAVAPLAIEVEDGISLFARPIAEFRGRRYDNCVRAIAAACETYLRHVYESILRRPCPSKITMGELVHDIKQATRAEKSGNGIHSSFANASRDGMKFVKSYNKGSIGSIDEAVGHIKRLCEAISELQLAGRPDETAHGQNSIFPLDISDHIAELIKYRNTASHGTRWAVGEFEAQRSAICLYRFLSWWYDRRTHTDEDGNLSKLK